MSSGKEVQQNLAAPVDQAERIVILDSLRGVAILGILLMNIPAFGMANNGGDPSILNEFGTINFKVWYFVDWFPSGTQRALFSMLFGAGIILFVNGKEKRIGGMLPADYFFRRQLWLMIFSLFDVFILLWWGDILLDYACLGMVMFAFRNLSPKRLLVGAGFCFLFMLARENADLYQDKKIIYRGEIAAAVDTSKIKLNNIQKEELKAMLDFKERTTQESKLKRMEKVIQKTTGSYEALYVHRTNIYILIVWSGIFFLVSGMFCYSCFWGWPF